MTDVSLARTNSELRSQQKQKLTETESVGSNHCADSTLGRRTQAHYENKSSGDSLPAPLERGSDIAMISQLEQTGATSTASAVVALDTKFQGQGPQVVNFKFLNNSSINRDGSLMQHSVYGAHGLPLQQLRGVTTNNGIIEMAHRQQQPPKRPPGPPRQAAVAKSVAGGITLAFPLLPAPVSSHSNG